jgi:hypothetical protein
MIVECKIIYIMLKITSFEIEDLLKSTRGTFDGA